MSEADIEQIAREAGETVKRIVADTPVPFVGTVYGADGDVIGYCNTLNGYAIAGTFTRDADRASSPEQVARIAAIRGPRE
jgi:hypothetical protein